jgi:hypothetical protein
MAGVKRQACSGLCWFLSCQPDLPRRDRVPGQKRQRPHTLGLEPEVWRVPSKGHDIRSLWEYEGDLKVDERIVINLVAACQVVPAKVDALAAISK